MIAELSFLAMLALIFGSVAAFVLGFVWFIRKELWGEQ